MKMKLHELELHSVDPEKSKSFYQDQLGLGVNIDIEGLKCYHAGHHGVEVNKSIHHPGRVSVSFLVEDLKKYVEELRNKGMEIADPKPAHLEMISTFTIDPDGIRIEFQQPTEKSPDWLKDMIK